MKIYVRTMTAERISGIGNPLCDLIEKKNRVIINFGLEYDGYEKCIFRSSPRYRNFETGQTASGKV